jgi:hypothetical protein
MDNHKSHACGRIGSTHGVLCAALGILVIVLIFGPSRLIDLIKNSEPGFILSLGLALLSLFVSAAVLGMVAGRVICSGENQMHVNLAVGIALAFTTIVVSVLIGTTSGVLMSGGNESTNLFTVFLGLMFWILLFGGIPAAGLGVLYGVLVRKQLSKTKLVRMEG